MVVFHCKVTRFEAQQFLIKDMKINGKFIKSGIRFAFFFISIFSLSCNYMEKEKEAARVELTQLTENIMRDISAISKETEGLAKHVKEAYKNSDSILTLVDKSKYRMADNGCFYKAVCDGKASLWVSGYFPVDEKIKRIAYFTEAIDKELERIVKENPAVAQAYYNDKYSLNRIFPPFDVLSQYPPKINVSEYNFYYLADETHNPGKKVVWVNTPYIDPAGRGWMISAIAPVYFNGELAGVAGLDITVNTITDRYISADSKNIMLVDSKGVVVSADKKLSNFFGLPPLYNHKYLAKIKKDQYRTDDFNLLKSKLKPVRKLANKLLAEDYLEAAFSFKKVNYMIVSKPIRDLNWKALMVIECK